MQRKSRLSAAPDGSITDESGRVLYFSVSRFMRDIANGDCCFLCGVPPGRENFNDEHVVPQWLLRKFGLHGRRVTLPNGTRYAYGSYTVPCCEKCNTFLGRAVETPISNLFRGGFAAVSEYLRTNSGWDVFRWLALLFLKTHLKDRNLPLHRDARKGTESIDDLYQWTELHHIHCVARQVYTGLPFDPGLHGSLLLLSMPPPEDGEHAFDYCDLYNERAVLVRCNDVAIIAVLNDACGALAAMRGRGTLDSIVFPLKSEIQLREVFAHLTYNNSLLGERPKFFTQTDLDAGSCVMHASHPENVHFVPGKSTDFGRLLLQSIEGFPVSSEIREQVAAGTWTFLEWKPT